MSTEPQLFRVNPDDRQTDRIEEVDFAQLGLRERRDIQEWVAANPDILGEDLLIIAKEFSGFDRTSERLDLLAVDQYGKLVVIELKRDDSGADVHWQAIKYASYLNRADEDAIVEMLAHHKKISQEDAVDRLTQHIGGDDLNALNNDQRIILASHRFAPEVTSAALWLNEKAPGENLITCVKLTPHRDADTNSLYVQASTIIPLPGADEMDVNLRASGIADGHSSPASSRRAAQRNRRNDEVTRFMRRVRELILEGLSADVRPDRRSKHAGAGKHGHYGKHRYYHLWYKRSPWHNWDMSYRIELFQNNSEEADSQTIPMIVKWRQLASEHWAWTPPEEEGALKTSCWEALVRFTAKPQFAKALLPKLATLQIHADQIVAHGEWGCNIEVVRGGDALDDIFANTLADTLRPFIGQITPVVDNLEDETNEEDD